MQVQIQWKTCWACAPVKMGKQFFAWNVICLPSKIWMSICDMNFWKYRARLCILWFWLHILSMQCCPKFLRPWIPPWYQLLWWCHIYFASFILDFTWIGLVFGSFVVTFIYYKKSIFQRRSYVQSAKFWTMHGHTEKWYVMPGKPCTSMAYSDYIKSTKYDVVFHLQKYDIFKLPGSN